MKNLSIKKPGWIPANKHIEYVLLGIIAVLLWFSAPKLFVLPNGNSEEIATSIGLMLLLSLISFSLVLGLTGVLLYRFWLRLGLPALEDMVLGFKTLELWEQLKFAIALFALLLLGAIGVLTAVL